MSEQAEINQEDEIEVESEELDTELETEAELEEDAGEETAESEDEVEIILEGEESPTSEPTVPVSALYKARSRLRGVKAEKKDSDSEHEQRLRMKDAEIELLQTKLNQGKTKSKPKLEDFDTDEAYEAELGEYYKGIARTEARAEVQATLETQTTQTTQAQQDQKLEANVTEHYQRSSGLKVSDYDAAEERAIEVLGLDVAKHIMANSDKSHILLYHFGKNEAKAAEFKHLIESNPISGLMELGAYANKLKAKAKRSTAPDPETKVEGGVGVGKDQLRFAKGVTFT